MTDLNKLDKAIEELEMQSKDLKEFNGVYAEILKLKDDIFKNLKLLEENNKGFAETSKLIESQFQSSEKKIDSFLKQSDSFQKDQKDILKQLLIEYKSELQSGFSSISNLIDKGQSNTQKQLEESYKDNKVFQKELDGSIVTRLDKHKSDIQIELRNEGAQIQRAFENSLTSNFNQMEAKLKSEFEKQSKKIGSQKILMVILIIISLATVITVLIKK